MRSSATRELGDCNRCMSPRAGKSIFLRVLSGPQFFDSYFVPAAVPIPVTFSKPLRAATPAKNGPWRSAGVPIRGYLVVAVAALARMAVCVRRRYLRDHRWQQVEARSTNELWSVPPRSLVVRAAFLLLADVAVIFTVGTARPGPVLSDVIEIALVALAVYHCRQAAHRSTGLARSFWALATVTFSVVFVGWCLVTYKDAGPSSRVAVDLSNLLFCFWFFPLAMALFLDPEREGEGLSGHRIRSWAELPGFLNSSGMLNMNSALLTLSIV